MQDDELWMPTKEELAAARSFFGDASDRMRQYDMFIGIDPECNFYLSMYGIACQSIECLLHNVGANVNASESLCG